MYQLSSKIKFFILFLIAGIVIYFVMRLYSIEGLDNEGVCPDPVFATDPNANIVTTLLVNDFMEYMNKSMNQVNSDLDVMSTLISGTTFNLLIDPELIPEVKNDENLPKPKLQLDSSNPPNYGMIFKLPKGRDGPKGDKGDDGSIGPPGPQGPAGSNGNMGKWLLRF